MQTTIWQNMQLFTEQHWFCWRTLYFININHFLI